MIELSGEYTDDIRVMGIDEEDIEDLTLEQLQTMADSKAFDGGRIRVMPDTHPGKGAIVGFTMPMGSRVVPNVVGSDKGCGMEAQCLGPELPVTGEELDSLVRNKVPMGSGPDGLKAPDRNQYHVKNDFPWEDVNETLDAFIDAMDEEYIEPMQDFLDSGGYDIEYFKDLCGQAAQMSPYFDLRTGISSIGTLGSGNHFIEIGKSVNTGDYWVVVHSGSRGLGNKSAKFHQQQANKLRRVERVRDRLRDVDDEYIDNFTKFDLDEVRDTELLHWVQGAMGESFVDYKALESAFEDDRTKIEEIGNILKDAIPDESSTSEESLDYLEGEEAADYLIDLIFCQKYAVESRRAIAESVAEVLGVEPTDRIESIHNYIDFRDGIIRKGATRSYEGERAVIPFNMRDGILIVEGKSNPRWNYSAPHGAGRVMSRRQADDEFTEEYVSNELDKVGAFATAFPTDESPEAYKNASLIESAIEGTAEIVDRLEVVHNFKADD